MKLVPAMVLAACAPVTTQSRTTGAPTAGIDQTANVESLLVTPIALVEDSRCPTDVQCVWPGRLIVRALVRSGQWAKQLDLTLGEPQHIADGQIMLVSAAPGKLSTRPIQPTDYRFKFAFSGGL